MNYYSYRKSRDTCNTYPTSIKSNYKFLKNCNNKNIYDIYNPVHNIGYIIEEKKHDVSCNIDGAFGDKNVSDNETCSMNGNGVCSKWKNDPKLWGPHLWAYLHYSAMNYPENPSRKEIDEMINWLCSLPVTIPCDNCSKHYRGYIEKNKNNLPVICSNKDTLFNFLVDIHNKVNERNGKPIMSYEDARKLYS
jgi:hypothetical protein